jgi:hypothetical protein
MIMVLSEARELGRVIADEAYERAAQPDGRDAVASLLDRVVTAFPHEAEELLAA